MITGQELRKRILLHLHKQALDDRISLTGLCEAIDVSAKKAVIEALGYLATKGFVETKSVGPSAMLCKITHDGREIVGDLLEDDAEESVVERVPPISGAEPDADTTESYLRFTWVLDGLGSQHVPIVQRQDVIERIKGILENSDNRRVVFLYGQPKVGKTFVLEQLQGTLQDHYVPIFIHVDGWASTRNQSAFLHELAEHIRLGVESLGTAVQIEALGQVPELEATAKFHSFMHDLFQNIDTGGKPFLLMFDELEYLAREETDGRIFEYLTGFIETYYQRARFIFAGSGDMFDLLQQDALARLLAKGSQVCLDCFTEVVTRDLVTALTAPFFALEPAALDMLVYLTDGHPSFLKEVLGITVRCWSDKPQKSVVKEDDITTILKAIRTELSPMLTDTWHRLSVPEKAILRQIAADDMRSFQAPDITVTRRYHSDRDLRRLVDRQILDFDPHKAQYTVRLGLLVDSVSYGVLR